MTVEEKAKKYADDVAFLVPYDGTMNFYDEKRLKTAKIDYLAGHNEAMRWRDPEKELPEKDEMVLIQVQIRYTDTIVKVFPSIGILSECGLTHKMRLIDTHRSNGLIIGWRPIE